MKRFRSFRESFRRRREDKQSVGNDPSNVHQWQSDEIAVRQGNCTFPIKYLGCVEVFESRGMPICEEALKVLRSTKRKSIRGMLLVSADGLRVVDGETRGLIVDQTIEKVSFCAPDRNNKRGFAYICRDGTTRRWMCHGFNAVASTGERLSHAVGCAFAICLEKKQKREREAAEMAAAAAAAVAAAAATAAATANNVQSRTGAIDTATGPMMMSNQIKTMTPSLVQQHPPVRDAQAFKPSEPPPIRPVINPYAIDRPHATPLMLQRQTSFRPLSNLGSQSPFKRQLSLKLAAYQQSNASQRMDVLTSI